jgi:hypothetical protein
MHDVLKIGDKIYLTLNGKKEIGYVISAYEDIITIRLVSGSENTFGVCITLNIIDSSGNINEAIKAA